MDSESPTRIPQYTLLQTELPREFMFTFKSGKQSSAIEHIHETIDCVKQKVILFVESELVDKLEEDFKETIFQHHYDNVNGYGAVYVKNGQCWKKTYHTELP